MKQRIIVSRRASASILLHEKCHIGSKLRSPGKFLTYPDEEEHNRASLQKGTACYIIASCMALLLSLKCTWTLRLCHHIMCYLKGLIDITGVMMSLGPLVLKAPSLTALLPLTDEGPHIYYSFLASLPYIRLPYMLLSV